MKYFAVIPTFSGTFAEDTLRLIRDPQNRTLDDVIRIHEDLCTIVFSTVSAYSVWFLLHVISHGVVYMLLMIWFSIELSLNYEVGRLNQLPPSNVIELVILLLFSFYFFIFPFVFAARISSNCAGKILLFIKYYDGNQTSAGYRVNEKFSAVQNLEFITF